MRTRFHSNAAASLSDCVLAGDPRSLKPRPHFNPPRGKETTALIGYNMHVRKQTSGRRGGRFLRARGSDCGNVYFYKVVESLYCLAG